MTVLAEDFADRFAAWQRSERRHDARWHVENLHEYEALFADEHSDVWEPAEAAYMRRRIEGHAIRAFAALLSWGLS